MKQQTLGFTDRNNIPWDLLPHRFKRWLTFHRDNPHVFELFREQSRVAKQAGMSKCGARFIGERLRWVMYIETRSDDDYKLNNDWWPYYSRLLMLTEPAEFDGYFERRDSRFDVSDDWLVKYGSQFVR